MPLNVVKSIPLKYAATSITLIDGGVITTTGVDSFSVVYDITLNKPKPVLINQFDGASGRRKSLFSAGNTVIELVDSSQKALVFYAGKEFELRFGGRSIVNVAISEDGDKVACVMADIPMKLDEDYYSGVDNVYVVELESFALSVMAFQSQLGAAIDNEKSYKVDFGLAKADADSLRNRGVIRSMRTIFSTEDSLMVFHLVTVTFVPGTDNLFCMATHKTRLVGLYLGEKGEPLQLKSFKQIQYNGMNNRSHINGQKVYSVSSDASSLFVYDLESELANSMDVPGKSLQDVVIYKDKAFVLAFNRENGLYELLDEDLNVVFQDQEISELAASSEYLALASGSNVILFQ